MADETKGRGANGAAAAEDAKPTTERVVLKRERVLVLPDGVRIEELVAAKDEKAMLKLLGLKAGDPYAEAWVIVSQQRGGNMDAAITAYTGPAGEPDTKVGVFKAPPVRSWAGGVELEAPPKPLVRKKAIE